MLRLFVLLLLLANGAYFAWSRGHLMALGLGPVQQAEAHRLQQQLRPESVRLLTADEARRLESAAAAAPRGVECLQTGLLEAAQVASLRALLEAWPAGSWNVEATVEPGRWIVYMGRYANVEQVARQRAELRQLGISFENPANPALLPGLSLGGHPSEAAASAQLQSLETRGVRTARVVVERPEQRGERLVLPAIDDTLRPRLEDIRAALGGRTLRPCR